MLVNPTRLRDCRAAYDRFFPLPFLLSPVLRTVRSAEHMVFIILTGSHALIFAPPYAAVVHDIDLTHMFTKHTSPQHTQAAEKYLLLQRSGNSLHPAVVPNRDIEGLAAARLLGVNDYE